MGTVAFTRTGLITALSGLCIWAGGCGEADPRPHLTGAGGERSSVASSTEDSKHSAPARRAPSIWSDVASLGKALADPMLDDPGTVSETPEMDELYAAANSKLMEYGALATAPPRVASLAAEASSAQDDFLAAHRQLHAASGGEGGAILLGLGLVLGNPALAFSGLQGAVEGAESYAAIQRAYAIAFPRNRGAQLSLRDLADQSSDVPLMPGMIAIDLDESWPGLTTPYDVLTLQNTSGGTIHDAIVEVTLMGADGSKARNLHFVERWEAGSPVFARYGIGVTVGSATVGKQTVSDVQSLTVSVWSRHAKSGPVTYQYAGAEEAEDVRRHLDQNLKITAQLFDYGILRYIWSARFWLDGVSGLPPSQLKVRFHCGEQVIERTRTVGAWSQGRYADVIPDGPALPSKPTRVDVTLSFPDNDYRWERTFDFSTPSR